MNWPPLDVLLVGYFPRDGAIAELFLELGRGLGDRLGLGILAPSHIEDAAGAAEYYTFPYSSSRPDRAIIGRGWRAHRAAAARQPRSVLLFTQHPLNSFAIRVLRPPRTVLWWHEPERRGQVGSLKGLVYGLNDRLVVPRTDAFVVASPSVSSSVPDELRPHTVVVPFPLPREFSNSSSRFVDDGCDVLFFGKLAPYKGLDTLALALQILDSRGLRPRVRILGMGSLADAAPALARYAASHPGRVEHVDEYSPAPDVASAILSAKVVALPYLTAAGSSTIAVAGCHGAALAAARSGSFGDFLVHDETAVLHEPGDAATLADHLERLLDAPPTRARLGAALQTMCQRTFDTDVVAEQLASVLLGGRDGHAPRDGASV